MTLLFNVGDGGGVAIKIITQPSRTNCSNIISSIIFSSSQSRDKIWDIGQLNSDFGKSSKKEWEFVLLMTCSRSIYSCLVFVVDV